MGVNPTQSRCRMKRDDAHDATESLLLGRRAEVNDVRAGIPACLKHMRSTRDREVLV